MAFGTVDQWEGRTCKNMRPGSSPGMLTVVLFSSLFGIFPDCLGGSSGHGTGICHSTTVLGAVPDMVHASAMSSKGSKEVFMIGSMADWKELTGKEVRTGFNFGMLTAGMGQSFF